MKNFEQWNGFKGNRWKEKIDVRNFIGMNYTPYDGDASFLEGPTEATNKLWGKLRGLRINEDENGKTNLALADVDGEVLVVSQFTLFADCRHGRRPSFTDAGAPDVANELYEYFLTLVRQDVEHVAHGIFGADMKVDLVNDGPFTIVLDTDNL